MDPQLGAKVKLMEQRRDEANAELQMQQILNSGGHDSWDRD